MKNRALAFFVVLCSVLGTACKKPSKTELRSLDNFTRAEGQGVDPNECSGNFNGPVDHSRIDVSALAERDRGVFRGYVVKALSAIPENMKSDFFQHGSIRLVPDAGPECRKILSAKDQKFAAEVQSNNLPSRIDACWDIRSLPEVKIILSASPAVIAHSTVRIFASLHTKIFSRLIDLAAATVTDKNAKMGNEKLKTILRLLPYALIEDSQKDRNINVSQIKKVLSEGSREDISHLQDEIYAEAFDSRFCSDKSRKILNEKFQTTGLVFGGDPAAMKRAEARQEALLTNFKLTDDLTPISETESRDDQYHYRTTITADDQVVIQNPRAGQSGTRTYSYLSEDEYYSKTTPVFAGGIRGFSYMESEYSSTASNLIYGPMYGVSNAASWAGNSLYGMWYGQ